MAWLTGWSKRLKMEIDELRIDENLTDFPVMISLSSGTGINTFNATDVFDTITPISGTVFSDDFTASGINWTHVGGTTTYDGSTMYQAQTTNARDDSIASYDLGKYWDMRCRMWTQDRQINQYMHHSIHIGYDTSTANYALRIGIATADNYGAAYNNLKVGKKTGVSETLFITDTQFNYSSEYRNWYGVRARRENTKLYFKVWKYPAAEPTAWHYEIENAFSDSDVTSGKVVMMSYYCANHLDDVIIKTHIPITTSKKLAITSSDGTTQLPVEVEYWEQYDKKAYLWTKIPTVSSGSNTTFYLYYDANQSDNFSYVGYTDSTPAENVWDSGYKFVGHMNVHPSKGYVKDSTSNNTDSIAFSPDYNNWQLTQVGLSYTFDNANMDKIDLGYGVSHPITTVTGALTVESVFKAYTGSAQGRGIVTRGTDYNLVASKAWTWYMNGTGPYNLRFELSDTGSDVPSYDYTTSTTHTLNVWYYGAVRFTPSVEASMMINDTLALQNTTSVPSSIYGGGTIDSNDNCWIGARYRFDNTDSYFDGEISEVRISNTARSNAWLKATYFTCFNQLLNFSSESAPSYYYQGYVKQQGVVVAREVRLYRRSTGVLVDYTTSASGDGYYYLTTPYNEDHFVVAFDDEDGTEYNALILDRLDPTGIV